MCHLDAQKGKDREVRIEFFIPVRPVPKQSFRVSKYGGYQPKRVTDFRKLATTIAKDAATRSGWKTAEGPVLIRLMFRFRCPSSARKAEKVIERWHTKRPDLDNLEKSIIDGIACLMGDDSQVCMKITSKIIAKHGEPEGTEVTVENIGEFHEYQHRLAAQHASPDGRLWPDGPAETTEGDPLR